MLDQMQAGITGTGTVEADRHYSPAIVQETSSEDENLTDKTFVPEDRKSPAEEKEKEKRERIVNFTELFIDAANEGGKPKVVYFKGEVDGEEYNRSDLIAKSLNREATKLEIFKQEPKLFFDCTGFVSFIYKETTGLIKQRGYLNDYVKMTKGAYEDTKYRGAFDKSNYENFLCMGKIGDLRDTEAYIRPGDIIALMKSEIAGNSGRHTMMYIGPEKKIKYLTVNDIRIAHVTSTNFIEFKTGKCLKEGKEISKNFVNNYYQGGVFNSSFRPYTNNHSIDVLYVIIAKNDAFMASQESDVVQDTLNKGYFDWDTQIKE